MKSKREQAELGTIRTPANELESYQGRVGSETSELLDCGVSVLCDPRHDVDELMWYHLLQPQNSDRPHVGPRIARASCSSSGRPCSVQQMTLPSSPRLAESWEGRPGLRSDLVGGVGPRDHLPQPFAAFAAVAWRRVSERRTTRHETRAGNTVSKVRRASEGSHRSSIVRPAGCCSGAWSSQQHWSPRTPQDRVGPWRQDTALHRTLCLTELQGFAALQSSPVPSSPFAGS